jgi:hypothetical protein
MGFLTGGAKKAAKIQAAATIQVATDTAANDRVIAQGAQQARETMIAQDTAAKQAAEVLSKPQGQVDVMLASDGAVAEIDPATGRRKTARSTYTAKSAKSGIVI